MEHLAPELQLLSLFWFCTIVIKGNLNVETDTMLPFQKSLAMGIYVFNHTFLWNKNQDHIFVHLLLAKKDEMKYF